MPNLDRFFEGCDIPPMFEEMPRKTAKLNLLKWLSFQLLSKLYGYGGLVIISHYIGKLSIYRLALRTLNIGKIFKSMLERHPQMYPSYHDIQLDLPETDQAAPSSNSHAPCNITVEYAENQISKRERNFLQYLSILIYKSGFVDKLAFETSLDAATLLNIQAIYHDPKRAKWTTQEYIAYHILVTWYASVSHTETDKLCKL